MIERMDDFPDPLLPIKSTFLFFFRASIMSALLVVAVKLGCPALAGTTRVDLWEAIQCLHGFEQVQEYQLPIMSYMGTSSCLDNGIEVGSWEEAPASLRRKQHVMYYHVVCAQLKDEQVSMDEIAWEQCGLDIGRAWW